MFLPALQIQGGCCFRPCNADGSWVQDWDSLNNHGKWFGPGYVEGTAWQFTYFVPHDYSGMTGLVGADLFNKRLEEGFSNGNVDIGNQPNMQAPWIFNYSGKTFTIKAKNNSKSNVCIQSALLMESRSKI